MKKFFEELSRRLREGGVESSNVEDRRLEIFLHGQPVLFVSPGNDVFLFPAGSNNPEASELYHRVAQTADEVYTYVEEVQTAPTLHISGLSEKFHLLADFGGAVLAGRELENGWGYQFVTWIWDYNRTGVSYGHYYDEDFCGAKQDFAVRSGLISKTQLFSPEELGSHSKTPKRDAAIILLAFNSGLRCVDIRNLKLHNIDWKKQELSIVQKKTGTPISAPLNGRTLNAIAEYILQERPKCEDVHVFLRAYPPYTAIKSTSPLDYMIDKYCRLASVEKIDYRSFHSLRRAFGTELAMAEVPVTSISQMLGHSDMSADKAYLSFNKTQTSLCSSDFSGAPITKGVYASHFPGVRREAGKGGDQE